MEAQAPTAETDITARLRATTLNLRIVTSMLSWVGFVEVALLRSAWSATIFIFGYRGAAVERCVRVAHSEARIEPPTRSSVAISDQ